MAYVIVTIVLALIAAGSAAGKIAGLAPVVKTMADVGVPRRQYLVLAGLELAGAVGLLVGFAVPAIGVAAAVGLILYFLGAALVHVRVRDWAGVAPGAVLCVLAVVALVLRLA